MTRILLTAFEPYDIWSDNSSWMALQELTRDLPQIGTITTRKFPVDFAQVRERLPGDLAADFRYAIFLGQAPGQSAIQLESTALNLRPTNDHPDEFTPLEPNGPAAYTTTLPLAAWANSLRQRGLPVQVSHHAGTYLCNALYYWGQWLSEQRRTACECLFIHLPVAPHQVADSALPLPSLSTIVASQAIRSVLEWCRARNEANT